MLDINLFRTGTAARLGINVERTSFSLRLLLQTRAAIPSSSASLSAVAMQMLV
jgi:hypothetical protein